MSGEQGVLLYIALGGERGRPVIAAADGEGRLVIRDVQIVLDQNGDERIVASELDGTQRSQVVLWDYTGAQQIRAAGEPTTGEARISLYSTDPSGDIVGVRSDEQRLLRNRPYEPYRTLAPVNLGAAWATVYTCPANTIDRVCVRFGQTTAGTAGFTVALRVNGIVMGIGIPVYIDAPPPVFGPFTMGAAEIIEAYRVGGANGAVSFDIERYSTGDVNTGV